MDTTTLHSPITVVADMAFNGGNTTMDSSNGTDFGVKRDETVAKAEIAVSAMILALAIIGNSMVVLSLTLKRGKLSRMHLMMLHLSLADLFVAFFSVLPQMAWDITYRFQGGPFLCGAIKYLQLVTMYASSYVLLSTAIDRYVAICKPFLSQKWTSKEAHLLVLGAWTASLIFSIPQIFIFSLTEVEEGSGVYDCWARFEPAWTLQFYITWNTVSVFIVPSLTLGVLYGHITHAVWRSSKMAEKLTPRYTPSLAPQAHQGAGSKQQQHVHVAESPASQRGHLWKRITHPVRDNSLDKHHPHCHVDHCRDATTCSVRHEHHEDDERSCLQLGHTHPSAHSNGSPKLRGHSQETRARLAPLTSSASDGNIASQGLQAHQQQHRSTSRLTGHRSSPTRGPPGQPHHVRADVGITRAKIKTVKLTVTVIICYLLCWTPFFLAQLWAAYDENAPFENTFFTIVLLLANLNSCTNPWIYMAFSDTICNSLNNLLASVCGSRTTDNCIVCPCIKKNNVRMNGYEPAMATVSSRTRTTYTMPTDMCGTMTKV